jgi:hypothetical protein
MIIVWKLCLLIEVDDLLLGGSTHQPDEPKLTCKQSLSTVC